MRIAVINHLGHMAAGAEHALVQFIGGLPADVDPVFFLFEDGAFAQSLRERFGAVTIVAMSSRIASAERDRLPLTAVPDAIAQVLRLARLLRAAAPDVVLTNSMKAHIIGSLAAKLAGIPCVNYVHDYVTGAARVLLHLVSRFCAQERVTCSKAVASNLGLARSTAVYSGIDISIYRDLPDRRTARAALGLPDDDLPVVAVVGRIARWKGQDRFIRIALDVLQAVDAHFVIIGSPIFGCDPQYVTELNAAIAAAPRGSRISFVPWQEDMRNVYAAIDLACNCSTREPFARTMLEALASGIPIVCFDDGGSREILEQHRCGEYVAAGDERAFARAVRGFLSDPQMLARAKAVALIAALPYDVKNACVPFAEVIARVGAPRDRSMPANPSRAISAAPSRGQR